METAPIVRPKFTRGRGRGERPQASKTAVEKNRSQKSAASTSHPSRAPAPTPEERLAAAKNHAIAKTIRPGVISKLIFGISSPEEILGVGRCNVLSSEITTQSGCILDPQMGPHTQGPSCIKCGKDVMGCPGHPGYIKLSVHVYHPAYVKSLVKLLSLFCFTHWKKSYNARAKFIAEQIEQGLSDEKAAEDPNCPRIEIWPCFDVAAAKTKWPRIYGETKLKLIEANRHCAQCTGDAQPVKYKLGECYIEQTIGDKEDSMDPEEVANFLEAIDNDTDGNGTNNDWAEIVGFGKNKLRSIVMSYFPVMANIHRQTKLVKGVEEFHSFTRQYSQIVAKNNAIREAIKEKRGGTGVRHVGSDFHIMKQSKAESDYRALNAEIYNLIFTSNDTSDKAFDTEKRSNAAIVSIDSSVKGKPGVLRKDVLGKGSDFSGRAVIIGDIEIDVDEVGISKAFADGITIEEKIDTEEDLLYWNQHMPKIVEGKRVVGWIKRVETPNGKTIDLENASTDLQLGDKVRRSIVDGDVIVISRQPVLHKGGLMGFRARVFEGGGNVVRINPAVTGPFNADFDGDEMNIAVPQELASRQETLRTMMVTNCVKGDQFSSPWVGLIQNAIVAGKQITEPGTILSNEQRNMIITHGAELYGRRNPGGVFRTSVSEFIQDLNSLKSNLKPNSGRAAVSFFLPRTFNYERSPEKKEKIIVENGFLISGVLDKADLGKSSGGMIDSILTQYGAEAVIVFLSAITRGLYEYLETVGFTLGAGDCVLMGEEGKKSPQDTIDDLIEDMRKSVTKLLESTDRSGTLAKLAQTEVDKQIAELGDRINAIVKAGGIDIVAKKNVLSSENKNVLLMDALENILSLSFDLPTTKTEFFPSAQLFKTVLGREVDVESFKGLVRKTVQSIKTGKRDKGDLNVEIEVFKTCNKILDQLEESTELKLTSIKAKMVSSTKAVALLMIKELNSAIRLRTEIVGADKFDNNFLYIVNSGAKGTAANVAQVLGSVGPQQRELIDVNPVTGRSLPFSERWTLDPVANGFCASSYGKGLDPIEFWHHAQASRGNIIESNLKPKDTGYFYRRAWIMMGDILTYEDGSARNENGRVVQFAYGGDMFDPRALINVKKSAQFIHGSIAVKMIRAESGKMEFEYTSK